jgi:hypothetical protein
VLVQLPVEQVLIQVAPGLSSLKQQALFRQWEHFPAARVVRVHW